MTPLLPESSKNPLGWRFKPLAAEARKTISENLEDGATATRRFFVLLTLSTTIAAFGLLNNSAAVIIGAMIIAPLMGPILGLSLGMVAGEHSLERKALIAEIAGVALAVLIGFLIGHLPFTLGVSQEMLARTSPTAYDLGIAFASGLAGAYASVNPKLNGALAGVAISVALVPPLATSGLLLAMGSGRESLGAFLLFLANFFSIQIAAALVFATFGLSASRCVETPSPRQLFARFAPGVGALILMAWFMTGTLIELSSQRHIEALIREVLSRQIARGTGGRLEQLLKWDLVKGQYNVVASALTPTVFGSDQVSQIEGDLSSALHRPVRLVLRSIVSQDIDRSGRVYISSEEKKQSDQAKEEVGFLEQVRTVVSKHLHSIHGAHLTDVQRTEANGSPSVIAVVQSPSQIEPTTVAEIQKDLAGALGQQLRLVVRNVRTQDADATGYLYQSPSEPAPEQQMVALQQRLESVLKVRIGLKPARFVKSVESHLEFGRLLVNVEVEATVPVRPDEVAKIQSDLRRYVNPTTSVTVHTTLESTASSAGWNP